MTLFSGCGNSAKTIEGNVAVKESGVDSEAAPETDDASGMPEERSEGTPEDMAADYSGYVFIHNGVVIEMDVDAASVIEQLMEASSWIHILRTKRIMYLPLFSRMTPLPPQKGLESVTLWTKWKRLTEPAEQMKTV